MSRTEIIISALTKAFKPHTMTYAKVPAVIFFDDAQFVESDSPLPSFIERLLHDAVSQHWPLLILVAHLKTEFSPEVSTKGSSFARILEHAREGPAKPNGPAAGFPGGFLAEKQLAEIDLSPVLCPVDLSAALRGSLTGLTKEQSAAILERTGGNPGFLEQVIEFVWQHEGFFEGSNRAACLTPEGLDKTLEAMHSRAIFELGLRRLSAVPNDVQEAICLASLQGFRFVADLVDKLAPAHVGRGVRESLAKGEDPYSMLEGTKTVGQPIGQFAQRLSYDVAKERRRDLPSLGGEDLLQAALKVAIEPLVDAEPADAATAESRALLYAVAANLFERSDQPTERYIAHQALARLCRLEASNYSFESAASTYERILAMEPHSQELPERHHRVETWEALATLYRRLNWPSKAGRALVNMFWDSTRCAPDGYDIFLRSTDAYAAREYFTNWCQKHRDWRPELYIWVVWKIAAALLELSELARALPHLRIADGDDPLSEFSFLLPTQSRSESTLGAPPETDDLVVEEHVLKAVSPEERAYALGGAVAPGEIERLHFGLLEDLAKAADDEGDLSRAEELLSRALQISIGLNDDLAQIATLSNLGTISGKRQRPESSKVYLKQARLLVEAILTEETFEGRFVEDDIGPDGNVVGSRNVGTISIPKRFSSEFDLDSNAVLGKLRKLKQLAANVYGNLAMGAQQAEQFEQAREGFSRSLGIRKEIGDLENMTTDLINLGENAHLQGDLVTACSHWSECVKVFRALEQRDVSEVSAPAWARAVEGMLERMRAAGCAPTN
jgi:tetratricopeptide (TPR) repeat protein